MKQKLSFILDEYHNDIDKIFYSTCLQFKIEDSVKNNNNLTHLSLSTKTHKFEEQEFNFQLINGIDLKNKDNVKRFLDLFKNNLKVFLLFKFNYNELNNISIPLEEFKTQIENIETFQLFEIIIRFMNLNTTDLLII